MSEMTLSAVTSDHMNTSEPLPKKFCPSVDDTTTSFPPRPPPEVSTPVYLLPTEPVSQAPNVTPGVSTPTDGPLSPLEVSSRKSTKDKSMLSSSTPFFDTSSHKSQIVTNSSRKCKSEGNETKSSCKRKRRMDWKQRVALLRTYIKYKRELDTTKKAERFNVWSKIAVEFSDKFSFPCDGTQCCSMVKKFRNIYKNLDKRFCVNNRRQRIFFFEARKVFGSVESSAVASVLNAFPPPVCKPQKSVVKSSFKSKWNWTKRFTLLQTYVKYKKELESVSVNEQINVWKTIAEEVSEKCSFTCQPKQCCLKVDGLRKNYERLKNKPLVNRHERMLIDEARKAFEDAENAAMPSSSVSHVDPPSVCQPQENNAKSSLKRRCKWNWTKRFTLLQTYVKYKKELCTVKVDEQINVWETIAEEVNEKCSFNCDAIQCRHEVDVLRSNYERIKNKPIVDGVRSNDQRTIDKHERMLIDEARKAFEDAENAGQFEKVNSVEVPNLEKSTQEK